MTRRERIAQLEKLRAEAVVALRCAGLQQAGDDLANAFELASLEGSAWQWIEAIQSAATALRSLERTPEGYPSAMNAVPALSRLRGAFRGWLDGVAQAEAFDATRSRARRVS